MQVTRNPNTPLAEQALDSLAVSSLTSVSFVAYIMRACHYLYTLL